ncbi:MAG: glycosyltransferase family 4 protein [Austwickia sp.]|nr:glycosyltransferase family 4 protein [Austwickia sp.]
MNEFEASPAGGAAEQITAPKPLRVLMVGHKYLPDQGGIETHIYETARRLHARPEFDITVLTTDISRTRPTHETIDGVPTIRVSGYPSSRDYYLAPGVAGVVRRGGWDLVHQQGIHTLVPPLTMAAARSAKLPYLTTFHTGGHSMGHRNALRSLQWRALGPLLGSADALVGVSHFEAELVAQEARIATDRVRVIRNGGGLPQLSEPVSRVPGLIVSSGRLVNYKGHQRVIEALPHIIKSVPEARLQIYGGGDSGSNEPELRALAESLGIADRLSITALPPEDREGMARALCEADVFAAMSDYEAHPVAVMEALSLGCSVVGLDIAGIGELVHEGWVRGVAPQSSPEQIAEAILGGMGQPSLVDPATLPTWDTCAQALSDLYLEITRSRKPGAVG